MSDNRIPIPIPILYLLLNYTKINYFFSYFLIEIAALKIKMTNGCVDDYQLKNK